VNKVSYQKIGLYQGEVGVNGLIRDVVAQRAELPAAKKDLTLKSLQTQETQKKNSKTLASFASFAPLALKFPVRWPRGAYF